MKPVHITSYRPLIIGHRGNIGNPPNTIKTENTIESFDLAWEIGADGIELDVQLTKDDVLVVHHDDYLGRVFKTANTPHFWWNQFTTKEFITDTTYSELQKATSKLDPKAKIPRLEEILPIPEGKLLFPELKFLKDKSPDSKYLKRFVKKIVDFINEHKLEKQVIVISFVGESLDEVKNLNPNLKTGIDVKNNEARSKSKMQELKKSYGIDCILPPFVQVKQNTVIDCRELGLEIYPWVWRQNASQELRKALRLIEMQIDGIITNQPGPLKACVESLY